MTVQGMPWANIARSPLFWIKYQEQALLLGRTRFYSLSFEIALCTLSQRGTSWDHQTDIHDSELVKELRKRVPVTPAHKPNFMFPYGLMTYGCANWAVESASAFSAEFCALVGVTDRFAGMSNLP